MLRPLRNGICNDDTFVLDVVAMFRVVGQFDPLQGMAESKAQNSAFLACEGSLFTQALRRAKLIRLSHQEAPHRRNSTIQSRPNPAYSLPDQLISMRSFLSPTCDVLAFDCSLT